LKPIRSCSEGIAKYVGKYVAKHVDARKAEDKGVRLVSAARGAMVGTTRFAWNSPRAKLWRAKVAAEAKACGFTDLGDFASAFGPRWAYCLQRSIIAVDLVAFNGGQYTYQNAAMAVADGHHLPESESRLSAGQLAEPVHVQRYGRNVALREYPEAVKFSEGVKVYQLKPAEPLTYLRGQRHSQVWQTLQSAIVSRLRDRCGGGSWISRTAKE
jgi:hypothetical protein